MRLHHSTDRLRNWSKHKILEKFLQNKTRYGKSVLQRNLQHAFFYGWGIRFSRQARVFSLVS